MQPISYKITIDDCHDYVKYQWKIPRIRKNFMKAYLLVFGILVLLFVVFGIIPDINKYYTYYQILQAENALTVYNIFIPLLTPGIVFVIMVACLYILILTSQFDLFRFISKKVYNLLKGQSLDMNIEVRDDGLYTNNTKNEGIFLWDGIIDIYDTSKTFLVFIGDYTAILIPKRAFSNENKANEFFSFVSNKIAKK